MNSTDRSDLGVEFKTRFGDEEGGLSIKVGGTFLRSGLGVVVAGLSGIMVGSSVVNPAHARTSSEIEWEGSDSWDRQISNSGSIDERASNNSGVNVGGHVSISLYRTELSIRNG